MRVNRGFVSACLLLLVSLLATACVQPAHEPLRAKSPAAQPLVWPPSPQPPRIRFINTVASPADLGIKPSLRKRLNRLVSGQQDTWFIRPGGIAVQHGIIYVADPGAQSLWLLNPRAEEFKRVRTADDDGLVSPVAVAIGPDQRVYLADSYLAKIFVYSAEGERVATIEHDTLQRPTGVAFDPTADRLYVADSAAHRIWIFTGDGQSVGTIGRRGAGKGEFNFPTHVAVDKDGTLYVTDALGFRIQMFANDGHFMDSFGRHGNASGDLAAPKGVAVDSEGHVYVVDALFDTVQIFDKRGRLLLNFGERGIAAGQFWLPGGVFIDKDDRIYVADAYNQRIQIFEYLGRRE